MAEVTLRSIRASVLCVGDAGIIFQPGERRVLKEFTPGLQRAVEKGWLLRENGKAQASGNGTETTQTTGEEQAQSGDHTKSMSGADALLFPSSPSENMTARQSDLTGKKGKHRKQDRQNQQHTTGGFDVIE